MGRSYFVMFKVKYFGVMRAAAVIYEAVKFRYDYKEQLLFAKITCGERVLCTARHVSRPNIYGPSPAHLGSRFVRPPSALPPFPVHVSCPCPQASLPSPRLHVSQPHPALYTICLDLFLSSHHLSPHFRSLARSFPVMFSDMAHVSSEPHNHFL